MIPFYAVGREIEIGDRKIIIKRAGVGHYSRLLYQLIEIDELRSDCNKAIKDITTKEKYVDSYAKILRLKQAEKCFNIVIEPFLSCKWKQIKLEYRQKVINEVIKFNQYETNKSKNNEDFTPRKETVQKDLEFILYFLLERGYTLEDASEKVSYYQAMAMIKQWKERRLIQATDYRIATNSDADTWKKFSNDMRGLKELTIEDMEGMINGAE